MSTSSDSQPSLDLVVEDEHECTSSSSDDVRERSLEEGSGSFLFQDLFETVDGSRVQDVASSGLHHQSSSDCVKRVWKDTWSSSDCLSEGPHGEEVGFLWVLEEESFTSVEATKVGSSVEDDTNNWDSESSVKSIHAIWGSDLGKAVYESWEFSVGSFSDIWGESCSCEIKGIDKQEWRGTSSSSGSHITYEEFSWVGLGIEGAEPFLVCILEGEVEGLGGEISDDIGQVTSPEWSETLFTIDSREAIADTLVLVLGGDRFWSVLHLQKQLYSFDRSNSSLGDSSGCSSDQEILYETSLFLFTH